MRFKAIQMSGAAVMLLVGMAAAASWTGARAQEAPAADASAPVAAGAAANVRFTATTDNVAGGHNSIRIDLMRWSSDADRNQVPNAWTQAIARAAALAAAGGKGGAAGGRAGRGRGAAGGAGAEDDPNGLSDPTPVAGASARPLTPEGSVAAALEKAPTLGYMWSGSEISGYAIRYAVRIPQPDGGERIILITNRRLGDSNDFWKPTASGATMAKGAAGDAAAVAGKADAGKAEPAKADNATGGYEFSVIELHLNAKGQGEGKISLNDKVSVDAAAKALTLENYSALPVVLKTVDRKTVGKS